jgi:hypothetical protein
MPGIPVAAQVFCATVSAAAVTFVLEATLAKKRKDYADYFCVG